MLYDTDPKAWLWAEAVAKLYDAGQPPLQFRKTQEKAKDAPQK
jgi:hypothetical protein